MNENIKRFSYPYIVWISIVIVIPVLLIFLYSFIQSTGEPVVFRFTLQNYRDFLDPIFLNVLWHSFIIAAISTAICLLLGYPVAWVVSRLKPHRQSSALMLFILPMWINMLLRTYAWITILSRQGILNKILARLGMGPFHMMYTDFSVSLGMVYNFLPFMILPIYTSILKVDGHLIDAARDLGASGSHVFRKVMLPLTMPGIITGVTMVFLPAMSTFVIPQLLGGGQYIMIGNLIERQFLLTGDWHFGSAISVVLMAFILLSVWAMKRFDGGGSQAGTAGKGALPW
ncbi:MAG: ABC transporter permease [Turicibacter sp.]|nr:ABC transporter permease [Turicibacter sp.]